MAKKSKRNPHRQHLPSPEYDALGKPGKSAHSARRRKEALRRRRNRR